MQLGPSKQAVLVTDPTVADTLIRTFKGVSTHEGILLALNNIFAAPSHMPIYIEDDTGAGAKPRPGSRNIKPQNRIFHLHHESSRRFMMGQHLNTMTGRFAEGFVDILVHERIDSEWTDLPDFYMFLRDKTFNAAVEALFGRTIFELNPNLCEVFWDFDNNVKTIFADLPRWMTPRAYASRDRIIEAIRKNQQYAREHSDYTKTAPEDPDWEPIWGAKITRRRHEYMREMDLADDHSAACEDLGLMFAANSNAIPSVGWMALHTLMDPSLTERVRKEVETCILPSEGGAKDRPRFDFVKLTASPLLQSIYAETLRLYIANLVTRTPIGSDMRIGRWRFPQGRIIFLNSTMLGQAPQVWNAGTPDDPHPLDEFWADRFIVYPDNPNSGPQNPSVPRDEKRRAEDGRDGPYFTTRGLSGAWIPYGGGTAMCPGRHFAKNEIIGSLAILVTLFDIELRVPEGFDPQPDLLFYGLGGMPIKDKIPFRIRKRC